MDRSESSITKVQIGWFQSVLLKGVFENLITLFLFENKLLTRNEVHDILYVPEVVLVYPCKQTKQGGTNK